MSGGRRAFAVPTLVAALFLAAWDLPACRALTVCGESCSSLGGAAEADAAGGVPSQSETTGGGVPGSESDAAGAPSPTEAAGAGGAGSIAAGAGASGGGGVGADGCSFPRAECDGTPHTVCESDLEWNARRCGACEHHCDGACSSAECSIEESVFENGRATAVLDAVDYYYFLTSSAQLIRVHPTWGNFEVLASHLAGEPSVDGEPPYTLDALARTEDAIYVWSDGSGDSVRRVPLNGGEVVPETPDVGSFGATRDGIYFTDADGQLWFRQSAASAPVPLEARETTILCSNFSWLLLQVGWAEAELYLARGSNVTRLGRAPARMDRALCAGDAALLLSDNVATLVSLDGFGPATVIAAGRQVVEDSPVAFDGASFSLTFANRGDINVRSYRIGAADYHAIVGLPDGGRVVYRDARYIWYNAPDPPYEFPRFKRASLP
jgi:hypothetical protein